MRLRERDKQSVVIFEWTGMDDDVYTWGASYAIRAALYPGEAALERRVSGETPKDTQILLYDGKLRLEAGMGVSLDGGTPSFRIAQVQRWSHTRAVLERIPEGRLPS